MARGRRRGPPKLSGRAFGDVSDIISGGRSSAKRSVNRAKARKSGFNRLHPRDSKGRFTKK